MKHVTMLQLDDWFPHFLRINFSHLVEEGISNEECKKAGNDFQLYMNEHIPIHVQAKLLPKDLADIIMNLDNPRRTNGYEPALVIHFMDFLKVQFEKMEISE